jgi:hypothetical protein
MFGIILLENGIVNERGTEGESLIESLDKGSPCKTSEQWTVRGHVSSWVSSHMSHMECTVLMKNSHMKTVIMVM